MSSTTTDISLIARVEEYLLAQGRKRMSECMQMSTPSYQILAEVHDRLGWKNCVAGRVYKMYLQVVSDSLNKRRCYVTPKSWGEPFVRHS